MSICVLLRWQPFISGVPVMGLLLRKAAGSLMRVSTRSGEGPLHCGMWQKNMSLLYPSIFFTLYGKAVVVGGWSRISMCWRVDFVGGKKKKHGRSLSLVCLATKAHVSALNRIRSIVPIARTLITPKSSPWYVAGFCSRP